MADLHYENKKLAEIYDLDNGWDEDREFYLSLAGDAPKRVLDIGCGTGLLCTAFAKRGHKVTGIDPARAMLEVARKREAGDKVSFIEGSAETFRSDKLFDLVIMTGHAFQVLLTEKQLSCSLQSIASYLAPNGTFAFETRNPSLKWAEKWHNNQVKHKTSFGELTETFSVLAEENGIIRFNTDYVFPDETLTSESTLRFWEKHEVEAALKVAGLHLKGFFGDWHKSPFSSDESKEMIFLVSKVNVD